MAERPAPQRMRVRAWGTKGLHARAPWYLPGKTGIVERRLGAYKNPEQLAYGLPAEPVPLYRIRFTMAEIWGDEAERPDDTIDAEIYEHWLEPIAEGDDHAP